MTADGPDGPFLIGIDVGSQSVRALLADTNGATRALAHRPTPTRHLGPDRAEYDLAALWRAVLEVVGEVGRGRTVAGLAVASVGEACVLLDRAGEPLADAITWFDRRTEEVARRLACDVGAGRLFAITGQPPDPTFSLCKLLWHRADDPATFSRCVRVLNIADWIAWKLSGEAATDLSLASRTACLDIHARSWSDALLAQAGIDPALLPPIRPSGTRLGAVRTQILAETGMRGSPVVGVGGHDHVVGGYAAGAARIGCLLDSMGTAEAIFLTVTRPPLTPESSRAGFVQGAVGLPGSSHAYVGGGINSSGGAVEWSRGLCAGAARDALLAEAEAMPPGSGGACFLPHLSYGPPPHADTASRGAFVGLTTATGRGALFRSVMEGLSLEARQMVQALTALPGVAPVEEIRVIGGSTQNALFLRIKAAAYGRPIRVVDELEATGLGAALLGGIAAGIWPDLPAALANTTRRERVIHPDPDWVARYGDLYDRVYTSLYPALRPINHRLAEVRLEHAA